MLTIWRRHTENCPHREKGRVYLKCGCPLWADGYVNGKRTLRQSLGTRDMARARKKATALEDPDLPVYTPIGEAADAFLAHADVEQPTHRKYKNTLTKLKDFCSARHIDSVLEMKTELLDTFRAGRGIGRTTADKELQLLKQFFGFCFERHWIGQNIAKPIKARRNIKPNDVEPYTSSEVAKIIAACDTFGRGAYERARARGMVLLLRNTALRIGDVALFARDRVTWDPDGDCWRIFLHTEKTGSPVFLPIPDALKQALDAVPAPRGDETHPNY
jgi:integrase